MVFRILRQFGDNKMTCSKLQVFTNIQWKKGQFPLLECDANEERFKDYTEKFPKCSEYCLPRGVWDVKLKCSIYSGLTVCVTHCLGKNGTMFGYPFKGERVLHNVILLGNRDIVCETPEDWRDSQLEDGKEVYEKLSSLVYKYAMLEENQIIVDNALLFES